MGNVVRFAAPIGALLPAGSAFALDVSDAVTAVTGVGTSLTSVGLAIIGLAAIALGIRWVKAMFF